MKEILVLLLLVVLVCGCGLVIENYSCHAQGDGIFVDGQPVAIRYDLFGGCLITLPDGSTLPLQNYRFLGD